MGKSMSCLKQLKFHFCTVFIIIFPLLQTRGSNCWRLQQFWRSHWHLTNQFSSVAQSCPTLCDPMNCSTPGLPVHHHLPEFTQTHVHRVGDAIQPSPSVVPFSSCPQSLPASESFPMSQLFALSKNTFTFHWHLLIHLFILFFFIFWPNGMWDLSSLTGNWTPGPQKWNHRFLTTEQPENSQGVIDIHLIHTCSYQNTVLSFFETSIKYALFSLIPS